jgi:hypothetical protein
MRATIFTITTVLGLALYGEDARAQHRTVNIRDVRSCAFWLTNRANQSEGNVWILGFWSGLNFNNESNPKVGEFTDNEVIFAEIEKLCREHPSRSLVEATTQVYDMIAVQRR